VHAHPHPYVANSGPGCLAERALGPDGRGYPVGGLGKDGVDPIASRLDDVSAIPQDFVPQDRVMTGQCLVHRLRIALPEASRAFDVGE